MAFGFSPKFTKDYNLDSLNREHFLVIAVEAAKQIKWNITFISETGFVAYTKFSLASWGEEVTVKISNETANIKSECTGSQVFDWNKNKENVENLFEVIDELKKELTPEDIEAKLAELRLSFVTAENDILNLPPASSKEKITSFLSIFKPTEGYFITPILLILNISVFILMILSGVGFFIPEAEELVNWGANYKPLVLDGEWWRVISCCFVHIGILHLLLNMYALLFIGLLLEPYLGKARFLAAYLIAGISASIVSLYWHDLTVSAGASGAIFGMYGVFLAMLTTNLMDKSVKKSFLLSIGFFVAYNLLNGFKPESGIDNAAHIGGLLSGMIIGYAYIPSLKKNSDAKFRYSTVAALTAVLVVSSYFALQNIPDKSGNANAYGIYNEKIQKFINMESMALEVLTMPDGLPKENYITALKNRGIYYWNENIILLNSMEQLDIPEALKEKNRKLKEYCQLRIRSYEILCKAIEEDTDKYDPEIESYNQQIETLISELKENQVSD